MRQCKLLILLLLLGIQTPLRGQHISDISFSQFGRAIQVYYTLNQLPFDSFAMLNLYVSTNGGISFTGPLVHVRGDIGRVAENGKKSVVWYALEEVDHFEGNVVFEIRGESLKNKMKGENLLMYNVSASSYAGLMYGRVARWGGYIRGKTDFSVADASYTCTDLGDINYEGDDYYNMDKAVKRSRLGLTVGALYRPYRFLYLYAGGGYGYRRLMWHAQTISYADESITGDLWAVNTEHSAEGLEAELGGIIRLKRFGLSVGVNTINFTFVEINGALGFFF